MSNEEFREAMYDFSPKENQIQKQHTPIIREDTKKIMMELHEGVNIEYPKLSYVKKLEETVTQMNKEIRTLMIKLQRMHDSHNRLVGVINEMKQELDGKLDRTDF